MADNDLLLKMSFLQYGKAAPKNSEYKGNLNKTSLFGIGDGGSFFEYTSRDEAVKDSMKDKSESFMGYTSRTHAIEKSGDAYFTMTNSGKLYTNTDREKWAEKNIDAFQKDGDIAWTFVLSFRDIDTMHKYRLFNQEDMASTTSAAIREAFRVMNIDADNAVWWEDFHTNTEHPHLHITFMEKEKHRTKGKLSKRERDAVKRVFFEEFGARERYYEKFRSLVSDDLKEITPLRQNVIKTTKNIQFITLQSVMKLYQKLPETGRLQYNSSMMIPYRKELDKIVEEILHVDSVSKEYLKYKDHVQKIAENMDQLGSEKISTLWESEDKKVRVQIANAVLNEFKNIKELGIKVVDYSDRSADEKEPPAPDASDPAVKMDEHTEIKPEKFGNKKQNNSLPRFIPMSKANYHIMQRKLAPRFTKGAAGAINSRARELDWEIDEYLKQKNQYFETL